MLKSKFVIAMLKGPRSLPGLKVKEIVHASDTGYGFDIRWRNPGSKVTSHWAGEYDVIIATRDTLEEINVILKSMVDSIEQEKERHDAAIMDILMNHIRKEVKELGNA